jgi:hypothetical protein
MSDESCECSGAAYNLLSACAICQGAPGTRYARLDIQRKDERWQFTYAHIARLATLPTVPRDMKGVYRNLIPETKARSDFECTRPHSFARSLPTMARVPRYAFLNITEKFDVDVARRVSSTSHSVLNEVSFNDSERYNQVNIQKYTVPHQHQHGHLNPMPRSQ